MKYLILLIAFTSSLAKKKIRHRDTQDPKPWVINYKSDQAPA